jgi:hypothetical protein
MSRSEFTLRELQPEDSPSLKKLITEFDGDLTTHFQVDPYEAIVSGTEYRTLGVVVEHEDRDDLVGMGTVRFGKVQFNGDILPFAFLDGLKVHKDFRGNGLGHLIAGWRVQKARELLGENCVIATGMLYDNYASHAVAAKWCREFGECALDVLIIPMRNSPPRSIAGLTVLPLEQKDYEEFTFKQNRFYKNHNLHAPSDANSIANAMGVSVEERKPYRFFVVSDQKGNLVAGAQTWARGQLKSDTINNPPPPLRIINRLFHLLPEDFTIRDIGVSGLWHDPGKMEAAKFLWETIRWECRDQGTTLTAGFDPRDPTKTVVDLKPWHQPRPQITLAIHGPTSVDRNKLFFNLGRV